MHENYLVKINLVHIYTVYFTYLNFYFYRRCHCHLYCTEAQICYHLPILLYYAQKTSLSQIRISSKSSTMLLSNRHCIRSCSLVTYFKHIILLKTYLIIVTCIWSMNHWNFMNRNWKKKKIICTMAVTIMELIFYFHRLRFCRFWNDRISRGSC